MCGILGFTSSQPINKESFKTALDTLNKRGPDDQGVYRDLAAGGNHQIFLGNRRLAILDLSAAGHQPMEDEEGDVVVTFNGEIYNYRGLGSELRQKGHQFRSNSDTEVLLRGFTEYGTEIVEKLDGMFAFAIYDRRAQKIFCARDHFGKKPLYYFHDRSTGTFTFASELKALRKVITGHPMPAPRSLGEEGSDKAFNINNLAPAQFLVFGYIPAPNSIYQEIKKLPAATAMVYDLRSGQIERQWRYWQPEKIQLSRLSFTDAVDQLDQLLHDSVKSRLVADVPLGSFLSGGVDSGLITAVASRHTSNLDTFTVVYDDMEIDERNFVRSATKHLGISPHFFNLTDQEAMETLENVLEYMDEPFADAALIPTAFLSQQTCSHVTVALSGDGGDELFGGYLKYKAQLLVEKLRFLKLDKVLSTNVFTKFVRGRERILDRFLQGLQYDLPVRQFYWGSGGFAPPTGHHSKTFVEAYRYADLFQQPDLGNKLLFLDLMIQLPDGYLAKIDRASMMHSLEVRTPFLQKELVEFVFSLPSNYKFGLLHSKKILKKVAQRYLPEEIVQRPKKGFGVPLNRWLRTVLRERVEESLQEAEGHPSLLRRGYGGQAGVFYDQGAQKLWREFLSGRDDHGTKIWRIFILNEFIKRNMN